MKLLFAAVIALLAFTSCAPDFNRPTLRPVVIKLSEPAKAGETLNIQGRYLGSKDNGFVLFNADANGVSGVKSTEADVVSWSASEITVKIPASAKSGGNFLFVSVGGVLSNGMAYSISK
jgi:IPT/TIG domain